MNKKKIICLILWVMAFMLAAAGIYLLMQPAPQAEVAKHQGQVVLANEAQLEGVQVYDGLPIVEGDRVTTGAEAMALIDINQNQLVEMAEKTTATFKELVGAAGNTRIFLEFGTLVSEVKERLSGNQVYTITTPNTTVSVRGTFFAVSTYLDSASGLPVTDVSVYEGDVDIRYYDQDNLLQELAVPAGSSCQIKEQLAQIQTTVPYDQLSAEQLERLLTLMEVRNETGETQEAVKEALAQAPAQQTISGPELPEREAANEALAPFSQLTPETEQAQNESMREPLLPSTVQPVTFAVYPDQAIVVENLEEMERVCAYVEATAQDFSRSQLSEVEYAKALAVYDRVQAIKEARQVVMEINSLPQPGDIVLADQAAIIAAKNQVSALSADGRGYLPQDTVAKLADCEESLALSQEAFQALEDLDKGALTLAQLQDIQNAYLALGDAQREALGTAHSQELETLWQNMLQNISYTPTAGERESESFVAVAATIGDLDISHLAVGEAIDIRVSAKPVLAPIETEAPLAACYEIKLMTSDGTIVQPKAGHTVTVDVQIPKSSYHDEGYLIWHYDDAGHLEAINDVRQVWEGEQLYLRFTTDSFSWFIITQAATSHVRQNDSTVVVTRSALEQHIDHLSTDKRQQQAVIFFVGAAITLFAGIVIALRKPKASIDNDK